MTSLVGAVLAIFPSHSLHLTNFVDVVAIGIEDLEFIKQVGKKINCEAVSLRLL